MPRRAVTHLSNVVGLVSFREYMRSSATGSADLTVTRNRMMPRYSKQATASSLTVETTLRPHRAAAQPGSRLPQPVRGLAASTSRGREPHSSECPPAAHALSAVQCPSKTQQRTGRQRRHPLPTRLRCTCMLRQGCCNGLRLTPRDRWYLELQESMSSISGQNGTELQRRKLISCREEY